MARVLDVSRAALYREPERPLSAAESAGYANLLAARENGTPVPYLTGRAEFWSLPFEITEAVLVPRPETELLVEIALELGADLKPPVVVDAGTGSGVIARALASEWPAATILACDRSAAAMAVARRNFRDTRVLGLVADWLSACAGATFDLVVTNPPYIDAEARRELPPELGFEPENALFAQNHGLADIQQLVGAARRVLKPGGHILIEHGAAQGSKVRALLGTHGYDDINTRRDGAGHERASWGRLAMPE